MIKIGGSEIADVLIGNTQVYSVYLGNTKVWEKSAPPVSPYDAQVEYLQTDGTAYIDMGFAPKQSTKVEIVMDIPSAIDKTVCFFGSRNSTNAGAFVVVYTVANKWSWRFGNKQASNSTVSTIDRYTFDNYSTDYARTLRIKYANKTLTLTATQNTFTGTYNMLLFTFNDAGTPATAAILNGTRCVSAKIYDSTTLVRDFIPVRKNGVGYLYDKVSGELFGNANSSGSFSYGNDVTS